MLDTFNEGTVYWSALTHKIRVSHQLHGADGLYGQAVENNRPTFDDRGCGTEVGRLCQGVPGVVVGGKQRIRVDRPETSVRVFDVEPQVERAARGRGINVKQDGSGESVEQVRGGRLRQNRVKTRVRIRVKKSNRRGIYPERKYAVATLAPHKLLIFRDAEEVFDDTPCISGDLFLGGGLFLDGGVERRAGFVVLLQAVGERACDQILLCRDQARDTIGKLCL